MSIFSLADAEYKGLGNSADAFGQAGGDPTSEMYNFTIKNSARAKKNLGGAFSVGDYLGRGLPDDFSAVQPDLQRLSGWKPELGYRGGELRQGRDSAIGELEARSAATPAAMYSLAGRAGNVLANRAAAAAGPMGAMGPTASNSSVYMGAMGNVGNATADSAAKQNLAANEAFRRGIAERQELEARKAASDADSLLAREKTYGKYMDLGLDDSWARFRGAQDAYRLAQNAAYQNEVKKRQDEQRELGLWGTIVGGVSSLGMKAGEVATANSGDKSDVTLKQNIGAGKADMQRMMDTANVYNYELKDKPGKKVVGVMAQELPPGLTKTGADGKKSLKANASTMFAALATVNQKNKELEARLNSMRASLPPQGLHPPGEMLRNAPPSFSDEPAEAAGGPTGPTRQARVGGAGWEYADEAPLETFVRPAGSSPWQKVSGGPEWYEPPAQQPDGTALYRSRVRQPFMLGGGR